MGEGSGPEVSGTTAFFFEKKKQKTAHHCQSNENIMSSLVERRKGAGFSSSLHGAEPASASSTSDWISGGSLGAVDDEASTLRRTGGPELVQNTKIISWHERVYAWFKGVRLHRCDVYLDNFVCVLVELYDWC